MTNLQQQMARAILNELRNQNVSQKLLAVRCGLSEKHVSQLLTGRAEGTLGTWQKLATMLGVSWDLRTEEPVDR